MKVRLRSEIQWGFYSQSSFQLFVKSRSITSTYTINVLRQLYADFPSTDPMVRVVMLLTVCLSDGTWGLSAVPEAITAFHNKLEVIGLLPLTREDLFNIMINPFVEKHALLLEYAKEETGMSAKDIKDLVQDVAIKCLEIASKVRTSTRVFCELTPLRAKLCASLRKVILFMPLLQMLL